MILYDQDTMVVCASDRARTGHAIQWVLGDVNALSFTTRTFTTSIIFMDRPVLGLPLPECEVNPATTALCVSESMNCSFNTVAAAALFLVRSCLMADALFGVRIHIFSDFMPRARSLFTLDIQPSTKTTTGDKLHKHLSVHVA